MRIRIFSPLALLTMLVGLTACASDPAKAKLDHMEKAIKQDENGFDPNAEVLFALELVSDLKE